MTIFIANLDFRITVLQLREMFIIFGKINECKLITDRASDRSMGYGFINFTQQVSADHAIKAMHGMKINGRQLVVRKANGKNSDETEKLKRPRIASKYNQDS